MSAQPPPSSAAGATLSRRSFVQQAWRWVGRGLALTWGAIGLRALQGAAPTPSWRSLPTDVTERARAGERVVLDDIVVFSLQSDTDAATDLSHEGRGIAAMSLRCTHMGCTVRPGGSDGGFACPCHQSRFSASGDVLAGPATASLRALEVERRGTTWWVRMDDGHG